MGFIKKAYFFKQKPKMTKEKDIISSSSNSKTDEENKTEKSGDIENSGKKEKIKKEEDEEEEVNDDEENIFIEVSRPSFISRNSIDNEQSKNKEENSPKVKLLKSLPNFDVILSTIIIF